LAVDPGTAVAVIELGLSEMRAVTTPRTIRTEMPKAR